MRVGVGEGRSDITWILAMLLVMESSEVVSTCSMVCVGDVPGVCLGGGGCTLWAGDGVWSAKCATTFLVSTLHARK